MSRWIQSHFDSAFATRPPAVSPHGEIIVAFHLPPNERSEFKGDGASIAGTAKSLSGYARTAYVRSGSDSDLRRGRQLDRCHPESGHSQSHSPILTRQTYPDSKPRQTACGCDGGRVALLGLMSSVPVTAVPRRSGRHSHTSGLLFG